MLESYVGVWASGHSRKGVIGYAASRVCRRQQDVGERRVSYKRGTDASWTRPDADDENRDEKERTLWRETEMRTRLYRQRPPEHRAGQHGFLPPSSSSSPGLACGPGWAAANGLRPCWGMVDEHKPTRGYRHVTSQPRPITAPQTFGSWRFNLGSLRPRQGSSGTAADGLQSTPGRRLAHSRQGPDVSG